MYLQSLFVHVIRTRTHPSLRVYVSMRAGEAHWSHTMAFSDILFSIYIHPYTRIHVRVRKAIPTVRLEGSGDTR